MEFTEDGILIEKSPNDLDELVLEVTECLESVGIRYSVVSGYVAVLFGRARATEDIDVITEQFDEPTADELGSALEEAGYWGPAMPLDDLFGTLAEGLPIRIAEDGTRVPNVELKFASDESDRISLDHSMTVQLPAGTFQIGSIEFQIAYKLDMGAQKDYEDALYLFEAVGPNLNTEQLEAYVSQLGVEDEYDQLRS